MTSKKNGPFIELLLTGLLSLAGLLYLFSIVPMVFWYVDWLDKYFLWVIIAFVLGILTFPLLPIAILIELSWHGWPHLMTQLSPILFSAIVLHIVTIYLLNKFTGKSYSILNAFMGH